MNAFEPVDDLIEDGRQRKSRRTREALATAALDLILDRGLAAVTIEAIADRAGVTRRTFSRHFDGKEDAALDFTRADGDRINAALRVRPAAEPGLVAYRSAVRDWLTDQGVPAWHHRPRVRALLGRLDTEPALFAAYERIRVDAQDESVRIVAERLGVDPARDLRPAVIVGAGAGTLSAALRHWARDDDGGGDLLDVVERAFDALTDQAGGAGPVPAGGGFAGPGSGG